NGEPDLQALGRMAHTRIRLVRSREKNGKKILRLGLSAEMRRWPDQHEGNDRQCLLSSSPSDPGRSTIYPMVEIRWISRWRSWCGCRGSRLMTPTSLSPDSTGIWGLDPVGIR